MTDTTVCPTPLSRSDRVKLTVAAMMTPAPKSIITRFQIICNLALPQCEKVEGPISRVFDVGCLLGRAADDSLLVNHGKT
jgi:hypothetical protein